MAKNSVNDYDQTAANNTDVASINIAEGCAPSNINNAIRAIMAHIGAFAQGGVTATATKIAALTAQTATHGYANGTTASYTAISLNGTALGTAATKATGTGDGQVPLMNSTGYPAANGSLITNLTGSNVTAASTSAVGTVELTVAAEALGGSDSTRAVTSAALAGDQTKAATGHTVLPGGLILNWGSVSVPANDTANKNFSKSYTTVYAVVGSKVGSGSSDESDAWPVSWTTSAVTMRNETDFTATCYFIAIGV